MTDHASNIELVPGTRCEYRPIHKPPPRTARYPPSQCEPWPPPRQREPWVWVVCLALALYVAALVLFTVLNRGEMFS
jgi:hypothetical protein